MVYKVSKGGVRSGNTLRGLRSLRTRRYARQACIVGRSNLKPKEVPIFLDSYTDDKLVSSNLTSTDVFLSLNKKKRWLLPATVSHMIKTGTFNEGKTMVSLLERHKLKRRANCVSFVCNQGRIRHVAPKQKRYFTFNLDNIDNEHSNRQRRRQKAEIMKNIKPPKVTIIKNKQNSPLKSIEVFTVGGSGKAADARKILVSSKPEYRLEVFYPCPQTCSLAFNPKYTNVHMQFGEEGGMEIKSNTKVSRKGKRHRKRFTLKDLEAYENDIDPSDTDESWEEISDAVSDAESDASFQEVEDSFKTSFVIFDDKDAENVFEEASSEVKENMFASLIDQAEKARSLCGRGKPRRRGKQFIGGYEDKPQPDSKDRSHIVYTSEANPRLQCRNKHTAKPPTITTPNYVIFHSAKVILSSAETNPEILKDKFGHFYAEAESEPRRFVIDVSEDIQNLLCTYRHAELSAMYTSYLVFVHDGVYDEGLDTFNIIFNSNCCTETRAFKQGIPFEKTSIEEIMNRVASIVIDMKAESLLVTKYEPPCEKSTPPMLKFVNDLFNVNLKTFRTCDEIRRVSQTHGIQENCDFSVSFNNVVKNLDFSIFCDICYENINQTEADARCGTKLSKCSHIFCDDCWKSHCRAKLKDGAVKITCPGYECEDTVGPVTLLSLLHVSEVSQLFQRMCEAEVESSSSSKWCPNSECGRIIRLDSVKQGNDLSLDVTCSCGHEFCFSCLSQPHWPATCEQAEKYLEKIQTMKSQTKPTDDRNSQDPAVSEQQPSNNKVETFEIEGRICPKCSKFIEKDGGCAHMSCKCGHQFCWLCLKDWTNHVMCFPNPSVVFEHTVKVKVRHLVIPNPFSLYTGTSDKPKLDGSRQRTSLYKKALQERQETQDSKLRNKIKEISKQIVHVCQKDLHLKREILSICGQKVSEVDQNNIARIPLVPHVKKFLRSCCDIKRALHHVAEYTFVLLQDTTESVDNRRAHRLANDLSGYCIFIKSILELGQNQDMRTAIRRLADIHIWAKRALTVLLGTVHKLKC